MTDLGTRTPSVADRTSRLRTVALILAGGWLLATIAIGKLLELIVKGTKPDNVDVSQGLAYLGPLLIASWTIGAILLIATIAVIVVLHRREGAAAARAAWIVLVIRAILVLVIVALDAGVRAVTGSG